ncbi:MAG: hypothetical protein LBR38_04530 [Synergistaceae bacterium]|jgi:hypothetical protein|nr:hypothetical protein [Synergistaceae bacterium]
MNSTIEFLKQIGMPILQIVVVIAAALYLQLAFGHRIDMLKANDIEHLKNQNKAIIFLLTRNEKLSEADAAYIRSLGE